MLKWGIFLVCPDLHKHALVKHLHLLGHLYAWEELLEGSRFPNLFNIIFATEFDLANKFQAKTEKICENKLPSREVWDFKEYNARAQ